MVHAFSVVAPANKATRGVIESYYNKTTLKLKAKQYHNSVDPFCSGRKL